MKRVIQSALLAAVLAGTSTADDGLDEALANLKKKAGRQSYSTRANLHDQNLAVPKEQSEEDKALEEKLRQIEKGLDRSSTMASSGIRIPQNLQRSGNQPQEDQNWLTPALLDNIAPKNGSPDDEQSDWVTAELERQQNIRIEKEALEKESGNASLFNNPFQQQQKAEPSELNSYGQSFQNILSVQPSPDPANKTKSVSGWLSSQKDRSESPFSLSSRREKEKEEAPYETFSRFKPAESIFEKKGPSSSKQSPWNTTPSYGIPRKPDTTLNRLSPSWKKEQEKPLQPIEQIRKSSPIYKKDPFSDDFMPQIKKGIWE